MDNRVVLIGARLRFARTKGLFSFQWWRSTGLPNTDPSNPLSGVSIGIVSVCRGDCEMSAALCALTDENSSGYASAKRSAPYPPIDTPLMPRWERSRRIEYRDSM